MLLLPAGVPLSRPEARRLARGGGLVRLRHGVVVTRAEWEGGERHLLEVSAALAALGRGAAASHETAALLRKIALLHQPRSVHVTDPGTRRRTVPPPPWRPSAPVLEVYGATLAEGHVSACGGLRVTSGARTVVDLARSRPRLQAVVAADSALRRGACRRLDLEDVLRDCWTWPGVRAAHEVVSFADGRADSPAESLGRWVLHEGGLPAPDLQLVICDDWGEIARVDLAWIAQGVVVEIDGLLKYATPDALVAEKLRQEHLEQLGLVVVRLTWAELTTAPQRCVARVRAAFALAAQRPAPRAGWRRTSRI